MASSIESWSSDSIFASLDISSTLAAKNDVDSKSEVESDSKSKLEPEANNISRELSGGDLEEETSPVFTLFPNNPPELRNRIWKRACSLRRVIDLWFFPIGDENLESFCSDHFDEFPWTYKSHSQPPVVLHTSCEARTIGLKHYELSFGTALLKRLGLTKFELSTPPRIFVNWEHDIICPMQMRLRRRNDYELLSSFLY
jgi:hypothetical protein